MSIADEEEKGKKISKNFACLALFFSSFNFSNFPA